MRCLCNFTVFLCCFHEGIRMWELSFWEPMALLSFCISLDPSSIFVVLILRSFHSRPHRASSVWEPVLMGSPGGVWWGSPTSGLLCEWTEPLPGLGALRWACCSFQGSPAAPGASGLAVPRCFPWTHPAILLYQTGRWMLRLHLHRCWFRYCLLVLVLLLGCSVSYMGLWGDPKCGSPCYRLPRIYWWTFFKFFFFNLK